MKTKKFYLSFAIFPLLLGIAISMHARGIDGKYDYVSLEDIKDFKFVIEQEKIEVENLKKVILNYEDKIEQYQKIKGEDGDISGVIQEEINNTKQTAGLTDVYGPGVMIIIDDANRKPEPDEDPNSIIVHNVDVLNIVNDLNAAGAEAISINGQRLLSKSEIDCSGTTIEVNGVDYGHPFIIRAIGEPSYLESAVNGPAAYGNLLREFGIFVEVNSSAYIKIPKYSGNIAFKYIENKEGE